MKNIFLALIFLVFGCSFANAEKLDFKEYGFSIDSFEKDADSKDALVVQFFKPVNNADFATNANVVIQNFNGTLEEYVEMSNEQFKNFKGFSLIKDEVKEDTALWEYTIPFNNMKLFVTTKAFKDKDNIYLLTVTAEESDFDEHKKDINRVIDSFKLY